MSAEQVTALLEAARWAATWGRRQPVRFVVGLRRAGAERPGEDQRRAGAERPGEDQRRAGAENTFATLAGLLNRGNAYATAAGALILVCADEGDDENTALYSAVDAGAAEANLIIEAVSRGLVTHPMAGFDVDGARAAFDIPPRVRPLMVIAVGSLADYGSVSEDIAERDGLPRERLPLEQIAFSGTWGQAWG